LEELKGVNDLIFEDLREGTNRDLKDIVVVGLWAQFRVLGKQVRNGYCCGRFEPREGVGFGVVVELPLLEVEEVQFGRIGMGSFQFLEVQITNPIGVCIPGNLLPHEHMASSI
jgi:hypothetical protein